VEVPCCSEDMFDESHERCRRRSNNPGSNSVFVRRLKAIYFFLRKLKNDFFSATSSGSSQSIY
jgi:hypothetical protein